MEAPWVQRLGERSPCMRTLPPRERGYNENCRHHPNEGVSPEEVSVLSFALHSGGLMATTAPNPQIVQVPIADLRPDAANPRSISPSEREALARSIHEFGFVQPVLARRDDK